MNQFSKIIVLAAGISVLFSAPLQAAPKVHVGAKVPADRFVSIDKIDHAAWDRILKTYVDTDGQVDYAALKAAKQDNANLNRYLGQLSLANPKLPASRAARLAFWSNAYNAVTIKGILREYPTTSIRNHTAWLTGYNIWHDLLLSVGGKTYSLYQIEHEILRKMNDPRIHFAIVCASKGCPRLLNEAYVPSRLEEQLESNSKDFFARKQNFQYDAQRHAFRISAIIKWFGEDFGSNRAEQLRRIARWLPANAQQAALDNSVRVSYLKYDWSINEKAKRRVAGNR